MPASKRECLCSELLPGSCGHIFRWAEGVASREYSRRSTMRARGGSGAVTSAASDVGGEPARAEEPGSYHPEAGGFT